MSPPLQRHSVVLLVGSLSFDILQRLTGEWSVVNQDDIQSWAKAFAQPLIYDTPFMWFGFNLVRAESPARLPPYTTSIQQTAIVLAK